ncbi:FAR1-related protein, partial [Trifolium medium]|nr:FAR1-related protein [Trifolium medium]
MLSSRQWSLNIVNREHNHEMTQHFEGHKYAERLRPEQKDLFCEMATNMALQNHMSTLKKRRQLTATTTKHIYNSHHKLKQSIWGLRTKMQHLMKCSVDGKYVYSHRVLPNTET